MGLKPRICLANQFFLYTTKAWCKGFNSFVTVHFGLAIEGENQRKLNLLDVAAVPRKNNLERKISLVVSCFKIK